MLLREVTSVDILCLREIERRGVRPDGRLATRRPERETRDMAQMDTRPGGGHPPGDKTDNVHIILSSIICTGHRDEDQQEECQDL